MKLLTMAKAFALTKYNNLLVHSHRSHHSRQLVTKKLFNLLRYSTAAQLFDGRKEEMLCFFSENRGVGKLLNLFSVN